MASTMHTKTPCARNHICGGSSTADALAGGKNRNQWLVNGVLDVHALPPMRRHALTFESDHGPGLGESFVLAMTTIPSRPIINSPPDTKGSSPRPTRNKVPKRGACAAESRKPGPQRKLEFSTAVSKP